MTTRDIVFIALFAAIVAVLGVFPPITLPLAGGVPITAQTLGVMLAGGILGARRGALAMVLFVLLVMAGLPLLSGGRGGLGILAGPTAGFLLGWIPAAFATGYLVERTGDRVTWLSAFAACVLGSIVLLYAIGVPWVAWVADLPLQKALAGSLGFVPGDLIKAVLASSIIVTVAQSYSLLPLRSNATGDDRTT